jgi:peptide/nickel transport system substrate-binding protein
MTRFETSIAAAAVGIMISLAGPTSAENVLRWGNANDAFTLDPHSFDHTHTDELQQQIYETLVGLDSDISVSGHLAVAWKPLSPTAWEFQLREGVRFHDGLPFTAEDVVFSIQRAKADASAFKGELESVSDVDALGPHTVRITTAVPNPLLWETLLRVRIMSKSWAERHGVTSPTNFKAGEHTYASDHANGTGPFVLEEFDRVGRIVMVRNPDWWGLESYPHNIDRIERIMLEDTAEGVQALLAGRIDFLQELPYDWIEQLERAPGIRVVRAHWFHTARLGLDQRSEELRSSNVEGKNPFKDQRVREAMSLAIDVETLADRVLSGLATPAGMLIPLGVNGFSAELANQRLYDPEQAKVLLAEAGYPAGFQVTLDCPTAWTLFRDDKVCRALAEQLGDIGIDVVVNFQPAGPFLEKIAGGRSDFYAFGTEMVLDSQWILDILLRSDGVQNFAGYASPRVDELIEAAGQQMVTYVRDGLLEEVWRIVTEDVAYIPLYHPMVVWPMRANLEIPPDPWHRPRFRQAQFKVGPAEEGSARGDSG